ncbi:MULTISPECIES: septum site-determining protein MinC [unclassified Arsukibacterium]|uniref:septum site-determining protein MinC n=1 Tax=unclassified Arsukibacterium TaxID=2635278 RepID=UPI000C3CA18F|nr:MULTISPECIES: septum site-determining protein MinC [unclassified Arsukibacterium]MAA96444.1 septum site-determining protein MinC [Rheinheimera sp.]MBM35321.1 septum site-determining protein MinC [Rheinheimera sp.]
MSDNSLELKGSLFPMSVLHCADLSAATLQQLLSAKLAQAPAFFLQAPIVLNLSNVNQIPDFTALKNLFVELKLVLVGVTAANPEQKTAAHAAGLAVLQAGKANGKSQTSAAPLQPATLSTTDVTDNAKVSNTSTTVPASVTMDSKVVEQTVRSGQQIYAKGTDLIVKGAVGAGAEVIADGNIHIYGSLRGKAIAGANGDTSKRIYCYNLQAELVSIAGNYWLSDSLQDKFWGKSACIKMQDDSLVITELV